MQDQELVDLFWARSEEAIARTQEKYDGYCRSIAWNILRNRLDTEECLNDTWLRAWNSMPPQKPSLLAVFLGTITRNLSLDRWRAAHSRKRGGGQLETVFSELDQCAPEAASPEEQLSRAELAALLDRFLGALPQRDRCVFVRRYWYADAIADIAHRYHMSESSVKINLHRSRKKLRSILEQEGYAR